MPHYSFELHIVLKKSGELPIHMTQRVLDIYMSIIVELAYKMSKSYIEQGWSIGSIECKDFIFLPDISMTWND